MSAPPERDEQVVADRLERDRPVPAAAFRGALSRAVARQPAPGRPQRLGLLVLGCLGAGIALLALAAALI